MTCALFDQNPKEAITYIDDRPFNDARYAITWEPLKALGWKPAIHLRDQLPDMARWYYDNFDRFAKNGEERINAPKLQKAA